MIHDQDLPMHLWVELNRTALYEQNIISHSYLGNKNPDEMFTKEKPEVKHPNIYLIVLCLYTLPQRKDQNWNLQ